MIGEVIKRLRVERDLSQRDLAKKALTSYGHISRIELGQNCPTTFTLQRIANALDCDLIIELRPKVE